MTATIVDTTGDTTHDKTVAEPWVSGILIPMLPVTDLTRSAVFYAALLGLDIRREFVQDGQVTGLALGRADIAWGLNLRRRSTLAAPADLRGEHPVVWRVEDLDALDAFRVHAAELGLDPMLFEHDDAVLVRVVDPDDIDVYVAVSKRPWTSFQGYTLQPDGYHPTHTSALTDAAKGAGR
jgi:catechol 2,3-dioxygenase-like lactoylglutathione lyase family enzyme